MKTASLLFLSLAVLLLFASAGSAIGWEDTNTSAGSTFVTVSSDLDEAVVEIWHKPCSEDEGFMTNCGMARSCFFTDVCQTLHVIPEGCDVEVKSYHRAYISGGGQLEAETTDSCS